MLPVIPAIPVIAYKIITGGAVGMSIITGIYAKDQHDKRWYEQYKSRKKIKSLEKKLSELELQYQVLLKTLDRKDRQVRVLARKIKELNREIAELKAEAEKA